GVELQPGIDGRMAHAHERPERKQQLSPDVGEGVIARLPWRYASSQLQWVARGVRRRGQAAVQIDAVARPPDVGFELGVEAADRSGSSLAQVGRIDRFQRADEVRLL